MIVRLFQPVRHEQETEPSLGTIVSLLWNADSQANFHPSSRWISSITAGENHDSQERRYQDIYVNWPGREAVLVWLTSNQLLYEVLSFDLLPHEEEALEEQLYNEAPNEVLSN